MSEMSDHVDPHKHTKITRQITYTIEYGEDVPDEVVNPPKDAMNKLAVLAELAYGDVEVTAVATVGTELIDAVHYTDREQHLINTARLYGVDLSELTSKVSNNNKSQPPMEAIDFSKLDDEEIWKQLNSGDGDA